MEKKVYLIILDGFGIGHHDRGDAIFQAKKPFLDKILQQESISLLKTHGNCVGLPEFQTGGSEVGHITIGSGRRVKHLLTKINDQIDSGEFFKNEVLIDLFEKAKKRDRIHFMGLCSDGGIHSFLPHLFGLQQMAKKFEIKNVYIHAILDGRDVGERTANEYLKQIEDIGVGSIASVGGRFFVMDRDTNWDRVETHYKVFCDEKTQLIKQSWQDYLLKFYDKNTDKSDYYVDPVLLKKEGQIQSDDIVINFDYRTARMRQISSVFCDDEFSEFSRSVKISTENYGIFGPYFPGAKEPFNFGDEAIHNTLGEVVSKKGGTQLRISETEKFNHVTFFFSGQRKEPFKGENRILVPSPKCSSYAEKPEMSAYEQTEEALREILKKDYNLVVQNFANTDLVGHSGSLDAAKKAVETVDKCLAKLIPLLRGKGYEVFVTADHGNADEMFLENGDPNASHTKNLVPFVWVGSSKKLREKGDLGDIAPTILEVLDISKPFEMTGKSLI